MLSVVRLLKQCMVELALHEPDEALTTWALPGEALCCRASQVQGIRPQHQAVTDVLQERTAMIMGMNPKTLRARRKWPLAFMVKMRDAFFVLAASGWGDWNDQL